MGDNKVSEYVEKLKRNDILKNVEIRKWRQYKRKLFKAKWDSPLNSETLRLFSIKPIDIYNNINKYNRRDKLFRLKLEYYVISEDDDEPPVTKDEKLSKISFDIENYVNKYKHILQLDSP